MRSQTSMISAMLWSIRSTPAPCSSRTVRTAAAKRGTSASGRPAAGSSRRTKRGSEASARATPSRRSSPCASADAGRVGVGGELEQLEQLVRPAGGLDAGWSRCRAPTTSTFSRTESERKAWLCWKVRASPCRPRRCAGQRVTLRPRAGRSPMLGRSKPLRTFTSVDLPAPFGPISPTTSRRCRLERDAAQRLDALEGAGHGGGPERLSGPPLELVLRDGGQALVRSSGRPSQ